MARAKARRVDKRADSWDLSRPLSRLRDTHLPCLNTLNLEVTTLARPPHTRWPGISDLQSVHSTAAHELKDASPDYPTKLALAKYTSASNVTPRPINRILTPNAAVVYQSPNQHNTKLNRASAITMAANDYYNTTSYSSPATHNRTDAPLPPTPGNHSTTSISPVTSPFDDHTGYTYPSSQNLASHPAPIGYSNTSYHGAASPPLDSQSHFNRHYDSQPGHGGGGYQGDPFADQNAIPLREQHGKMDASPTRYQEGGVYERNFGGPHEKRGKKKKGWLSGRVTWVVYILTTVQIGVFVGELIKNGMFLRRIPLRMWCWQLGANDMHRRPNRNSHSNQTAVQHHDWPLALRSHQYGRPLPALHAQHPRRD